MGSIHSSRTTWNWTTWSWKTWSWRTGLLAAVALAMAGAGLACGADASGPAEPNPVSSTTAAASSAVIEGQVTSVEGSDGTKSSSASASGGELGGIRVTAPGSGVSDVTDADGNFRLAGAPSGNPTLRFERSDVDAEARLSGVPADKVTKVKVEVRGSEAAVVEQQTEEMEEFGDRVTAVSGSGTSGSLTLEDGTVVAVDEATAWDPDGDAVDLDGVQAALDAGDEVFAEGEGTPQDDGSILAATLEIEIEEAEPDASFSDGVGSADPGAGTLTLAGGTVVVIDGGTAWDPDGDLFSLTEVSDALAAGSTVEASGEGFLQDDGSILATEITAELEDETDDPDGDDPDGDDPEDDPDDGDSDDVDFSAQILAVQTLIDDAEAVAAANGLNRGQTNALIVKLENAVASLQRGNGVAAEGQLGAFVNQVEAFIRSGRLPDDDPAVQALIADAEAIIAQIRSIS